MGERRHTIRTRGETYRVQIFRPAVNLAGVQATFRLFASADGEPTGAPLLSYDSATSPQIHVGSVADATTVDGIAIPAGSGVITLEIPASATTALPVGVYAYGLQLRWPIVSGVEQRVTPLLAGPFIRRPSL